MKIEIYNEPHEEEVLLLNLRYTNTCVYLDAVDKNGLMMRPIAWVNSCNEVHINSWEVLDNLNLDFAGQEAGREDR